MRYAVRLGEVGAGSVVPFTSREERLAFDPKDDLVPIVIPDRLGDEKFGVLTVRGISLEDEDIHDGDDLICRIRFSYRDITPETICVVRIHSTGELVAKKIIKEATMVRLRASGGGIPDKMYSPDDIEVIGIAFYAQRSLDPKARRARFRPNARIPF